MKTELILPDHLPEIKQEDLRAAAQRREKYSLTRDIQAREFNDAIALRLEKEKEKERQEIIQTEEKKQGTSDK